jgi:hypothetical protein
VTVFKTRYGQAIVAVLSNYPPNSKQLYIALETLIMTAMENTKSESRDEMAMAACQGLHPGVGKGLVCGLCHDVVLTGKTPMTDDDEDDQDRGTSDLSERDEIARKVRAILGTVE